MKTGVPNAYARACPILPDTATVRAMAADNTVDRARSPGVHCADDR